MPRGSHHVETGWLREHDGVLSLQRDDGGRWRLDVGLWARKLVGHRVKVCGTRSEFDLLDVSAIDEI